MADGSDIVYGTDGGGLYTFTTVVYWTSVTSHSMFESGGNRLTADQCYTCSDECCHAVMFIGIDPARRTPGCFRLSSVYGIMMNPQLQN